MINKQRVGGKKRKAWRLKKKYDKWFLGMVLEIARDTLRDMKWKRPEENE